MTTQVQWRQTATPMLIINHPKERTEEKLMSRKGEAWCTSLLFRWELGPCICFQREIEQLSPFRYAYSIYIIFRILERSFKNPSYFGNNLQTSQFLPTLWPRFRETLLSNLEPHSFSSSRFSWRFTVHRRLTYKWVWKVTMDRQSQQHPYKWPSSAEALTCHLQSSLPPNDSTGGRQCNPRWEIPVTRVFATYLFLGVLRIQRKPIHLGLPWCFPVLTMGLVLRVCLLLWFYRR